MLSEFCLRRIATACTLACWSEHLGVGGRIYSYYMYVILHVYYTIVYCVKHIYIYIYIYVYVHTYVHTYVHICVYIYIYIYNMCITHTCSHLYIFILHVRWGRMCRCHIQYYVIQIISNYSRLYHSISYHMV